MCIFRTLYYQCNEAYDYSIKYKIFNNRILFIKNQTELANDNITLYDIDNCMVDEYTICTAAFFRNKGKSVITENEFLMTISMDLRWMSYSSAKLMLTKLLDEKILKKKGDALIPTFKIEDVSVPVAYKPSQYLLSLLKAPTVKNSLVDDDLLSIMISEAMKIGMRKEDFMKESKFISEELNIDTLVAGLIILRDKGLDVVSLTDKVRSMLTDSYL